MLGPQGPAEPKRVSDPRLVDNYEIKPSLVAKVSRLILGVLFVAACIWVVVAARDHVFGRIIVAFGLVYFIYLICAHWRQMLRHRPPNFAREGLHMDVFGARVLIPWTNIAETKVWRHNFSEMGFIVLADPNALAVQLTEDELRRAIRDESVGNFFLSVFGWSSPSMPQSVDLRSRFVAQLAVRRARFGGEVFIGPFDRDRGPRDFNALIEDWKAICG